MTHTGTFIALEGLDGSGQSTQGKLLKEYFEEQGRNVILTKEPTPDSEAGKRIRKVLQHEETLDPFELQKLFAEDRKEHLEHIIMPALERGDIVISDRYYFSTFAMGSVDCDLEKLIELNKDFPHPDMTFILDVAPKTAIRRVQERGKKAEYFEVEEKNEKIQETYKNLPNRFENVYIIDSEQSIEAVHQEIVSHVKGA